jgi:hypothetical protein
MEGCDCHELDLYQIFDLTNAKMPFKKHVIIVCNFWWEAKGEGTCCMQPLEGRKDARYFTDSIIQAIFNE